MARALAGDMSNIVNMTTSTMIGITAPRAGPVMA
jgi:hypothetical protein